MDTYSRLIDWLAGDGRFMRLDHCLGYEWWTIWITVALDFAVVLGYALIAVHWWREQRRRRDMLDDPSVVALGRMRNIFLFCGICGYLFIPIKMVWPAWRLYDVFLMFLVYYTWSYALHAKELKVVYERLEENERLREDNTRLHGELDRAQRLLAEVERRFKQDFGTNGA